jgi:hypothetical protein
MVGAATAVLTENDREADVVGLAAVWDWFVTTSTRDVHPAGSNPVSVRDSPAAATAGSVLSLSPLPVSQATVPRSCPPADVFDSVTL